MHVNPICTIQYRIFVFFSAEQIITAHLMSGTVMIALPDTSKRTQCRNGYIPVCIFINERSQSICFTPPLHFNIGQSICAGAVHVQYMEIGSQINIRDSRYRPIPAKIIRYTKFRAMCRN